jgi:hypothetical protein
MQEQVKMKSTNDDSNVSGRVTDCVVRGRERKVYACELFLHYVSSLSLPLSRVWASKKLVEVPDILSSWKRNGKR